MRLISPDDACYGARMYNGRHYESTVIDTSDPTEIRALRAVGYTHGSTAGVPSGGGFECGDCGFRSFFRLCSRCGGACERPNIVA